MCTIPRDLYQASDASLPCVETTFPDPDPLKSVTAAPLWSIVYLSVGKPRYCPLVVKLLPFVHRKFVLEKYLSRQSVIASGLSFFFKSASVYEISRCPV